MRMTDEDVVDGRQIFESNPWRGGTAHPAYGYGLTVPEDRVGEDVQAVMLEQKAGMANPGQANLIFQRRRANGLFGRRAEGNFKGWRTG